MAFTLAQKFVSLGMASPLAVEYAKQLTTGIFNWQRLAWLGMPPILAKYVAESMAAGTFDAKIAAEKTMSTAVAQLSKDGGATTYLGQLATRTYFPDSSLGAGSATWQGSRREHYAVEAITDPIVVFSNARFGSNNVESVVTGGTAKAAIETTLGTRLAVNDGGPIAFSNGFAVCKFTGVTIPKGKFWTDCLIQNANGMVFWQRGRDSDLPTEGWAFGTGAPTDYTVSGTPPASFDKGQGYGPSLILGMTKRGSVVILGTSRQHGIADWASDATGDKGFGRVLNQLYGYTSLAMPTSTLAGFMADARTYRSQILNGTIDGINTGVPYHSHMINYDLINDFQSGGDEVATAISRLVSLNTAYPKIKHVDVTNEPHSTSVDLFNTKSGQTITVPGTKLLAADQIIRAGVSGSSGYLELADSLSPARDGKWPVSTVISDTVNTQSTFTGAIAGQTLTVGAVTGPALAIGMSIHGSGVSVGTQIESGSGTTWKVTVDQTVTSRAMTADSKMTWDGLHGNTASYLIEKAALAASLPSVLSRF